MNCSGVRGLLSAFVDGELSPGELLRVEQHLRRCHCCADEVDALRQTIALVASMDEVEVPVTFRASLHDRLVALGPPVPFRKVSAAHTWQRTLRTWALPAAAAAAILAVGLGQIRNMGSQLPGMEATSPVSLAPPAPGHNARPPVAQPPVTPDQGGSAKAPVVTSPPAPVSPVAAPEKTAEKPDTAPAPLGDRSLASSLAIHTTSFVDDISEPRALPTVVSKSYTVSAIVADPAGAAAILTRSMPQQASDPRHGVTVAASKGSVVLTVRERDAETVLANIRRILGENVVLEPSDANMGPEITNTYNLISDLNVRRDRILQGMYGITDEARVAEAEQKLSELAREASDQRLNYERLQQRVSEVIITVNLQKPAQ